MTVLSAILKHDHRGCFKFTVAVTKIWDFLSFFHRYFIGVQQITFDAYKT